MALDKRKLFNQLDDFSSAWLNLLETWLDDDEEVEIYLHHGYPFGSCFNELHSDMLRWVEEAKQKILDSHSYIYMESENLVCTLASFKYHNSEANDACPLTEQEIADLNNMMIGDHVYWNLGTAGIQHIIRLT